MGTVKEEEAFFQPSRLMSKNIVLENGVMVLARHANPRITFIDYSLFYFFKIYFLKKIIFFLKFINLVNLLI